MKLNISLKYPRFEQIIFVKQETLEKLIYWIFQEAFFQFVEKDDIIRTACLN